MKKTRIQYIRIKKTQLHINSVLRIQDHLGDNEDGIILGQLHKNLMLVLPRDLAPEPEVSAPVLAEWAVQDVKVII